MKTPGLQSLFSQNLDRSLFAIYFLGAIVPMLALGYLVQHFALPTVQGDSYATSLILGLASGISFLSLAAFFALRRLSLSAVARMDADNDRLAAILAASRALATAPHVHAAAEIAVGCALRLTGADVILALRRVESGKPLELCEMAGTGAQAVFEAHEDELTELVQSVIEAGAPSPLQPVGSGVGLVLPMLADGAPPTALVVVKNRVRGSLEQCFPPEVVSAIATLAGLAAVAMQSAELKDSQRNFFIHATEIMVNALDSRIEQRTGGGHFVAEIANRTARELELDDELLRRLHFSSLLHDIGVLKLSAGQQRNVKQLARHPAIGHRMLSRIRLWEPLAEIVLHHHDHFDGGGVPDALRGEAIPLESRIIHVVDAFACMTHGGDHGTLLTVAGALDELVAGKGMQFDPVVVSAFERLVERGEIVVGD